MTIRKIIEDMTGLTNPEMDRIWVEVRVNSERLKGCPLHQFEVFEKYASGLPKKYRCSQCGGIVNQSDYHWWKVGFDQAAANPKAL